MSTQAKYAIGAIIGLLVLLGAAKAFAQIVPAQNQVTISPFGGLVTSTSTVGTRKLEQLIGNTYGQLTYWNGSKWDLIATSSLGITDNLTFNSPLSRTGDTVSFLFNTINTWTAQNNFSLLFATRATTTNATTTSSQYLTFLSAGGLAVDGTGKVYSGATSTLSTISGQLNLTSQVTGVLPYLNGGTGTTTGVTGQLVYFGPTSYQSVATGTLTVSSPISIDNATRSLIGGSAVISCPLCITGISPFTFSSTFSTLSAATSSPVWLQSSLFASSTVDFGTAGQARFSWLSSVGKLGIASSTPWSALSIGGDTASSSAVISEYRVGKSGNNATSTAATLDCRTSNTIHWPIGSAATTLTLTGLIPGQNCMVVIENPNQTSGALTWAAAAGYTLLWPSGTVPTQTTGANRNDIWSFKASQGSSTIQIFGAQTVF